MADDPNVQFVVEDVENMDSDESEDEVTSFTWDVDNFTADTSTQRRYSPEFEADGYCWRLFCFPRGNKSKQHFAVYLQLLPDKSAKVKAAKKAGVRWKAPTFFQLFLVNQKDLIESHPRQTSHVYHVRTTDWGYSKFLELSTVLDPDAGFIVDDTVRVRASVEVVDYVRPSNWATYSSRRETGFVGLRNQGATCYMNSLLQTLFLNSCFRRAVYGLPTEHDKPTSSIPLALQRLFYNMQYADDAVSTEELTTSFGWNKVDSFYQHDVQELNRVLCDNLEAKMKDTPVEGTIEKLFQGKVARYIRCLNVPFTSSREEAFYDLSLDISNMKNVYESFDAYVAEDILDGDNQYSTDDYGKQDAAMGVRFLELPAVLQLHLKRFAFDPQTMGFVKINDLYQFPSVLELDRYMSPDVPQEVPQTYDLYGVLVHQGGVQGGHYYAFHRSTSGDERWFKFDDDKVTAASEKEAINENFGQPTKQSFVGRHGLRSFRMSRRFTNAYMLIYVRRADAHWVMSPIDDEDVPEHLRERLEREHAAAAERLRQRREAHLYASVRVLREAHLAQHLDVDLVNLDKIPHTNLRKTSTINDLLDGIADAEGMPRSALRAWRWVNRKNKTTRPAALLSADRCAGPITAITKNVNKCKVFVETAPEDPEHPGEYLPLPPFSSSDALIFLKHYCPVQQTLVLVGRVIVAKSAVISSLLPEMRALAGLDPETPLDVWEEIKPSRIELVDQSHTIHEDAELGTGDILCFQRALDSVPDDERAAYAYPDVPSFFEYMVTRVITTCVPLAEARRKQHERAINRSRRDTAQLAVDINTEGVVVLHLTQDMSYDEICAAIGDAVGIDGDCIRLTCHNHHQGAPKAKPCARINRKLGSPYTLKDLLFVHNRPLGDTLYYEPLEMPLVELESKTRLNVVWSDPQGKPIKHYTLFVDRLATVNNALNLLATKVVADEYGDPEDDSQLADIDRVGPLRMLEIAHHKLIKVFAPTDPIRLVSPHHTIRVEQVPPEEVNPAPGTKRLFANFYVRNAYHSVDQPFVIFVQPDETVAVLKARIQERFDVSDEELATWRFALVSSARASYLQDSDLVLKRNMWYSDYLGIKLTARKLDGNARRGGSTRHGMASSGGGIKIYN